jgi:hypothetical protein
LDLKFINIVVECIFDGCKSGTTSPGGTDGSGGGIMLFWKGVAEYLLFSHLFFVRGSSWRGPIDITIRSADSIDEGYGTAEVFYLSRSQSSFVNSNKLIIGYEGDESGEDKSCLLPPYLPGPSYVASSNGNEFKVVNRQYCGTEEVRCGSISFIDDTLDPTHDYIINVKDGNYEEWKLTSHNFVIRDIRGESTKLSLLKVVSKEEYENPMFFIPTGCTSSTLILSCFTLVINTIYSLLEVDENGAVVEMEDLLINSSNISTTHTGNVIKFMKGRSIQLVNVRFNNISLDDSALRIDTGNVFFKSCAFTNISLTKEDDISCEGGVFHITVDEMKRVELRNACLFENCTVNTNGIANGGAIFIHLKSGYFYTQNVISFRNCSSISSNNMEGKGYTFTFLFFLHFFF